jgi:hypothetical protein
MGNSPFLLSSRATVTFSIFSCFLHIQPAVFQTPDKAVILSEALRRSIAKEGFMARSRGNLGDACKQMLFGAFRPQTIRKIKKLTSSAQRFTAKPKKYSPPATRNARNLDLYVVQIPSTAHLKAAPNGHPRCFPPRTEFPRLHRPGAEVTEPYHPLCPPPFRPT